VVGKEWRKRAGMKMAKERRVYPASAVEDFMADIRGGRGGDEASGYDDEGVDVIEEVEEDEAGWVVKEGRCARCGAELHAMGRCRREH